MSNRKLIYIIDDEPDIRNLVCRELQSYGFKTRSFPSGKTLLAALSTQTPDLCIVDLGLPDMDGIDLVKKICGQPNLGVMILSGRGSPPDRIIGLELGADDYIVKPFVPRELVARVNSFFRRVKKSSQDTDRSEMQCAYFAGWKYNPATLTLSKGDVESELSSAEHELLMQLLQNPKKILSRDQLLGERISPYDRSIDVRMSRVRKKTEVHAKSSGLIKTVYGVGYILTVDVEWY